MPPRAGAVACRMAPAERWDHGPATAIRRGPLITHPHLSTLPLLLPRLLGDPQRRSRSPARRSYRTPHEACPGPARACPKKENTRSPGESEAVVLRARRTAAARAAAARAATSFASCVSASVTSIRWGQEGAAGVGLQQEQEEEHGNQLRAPLQRPGRAPRAHPPPASCILAATSAILGCSLTYCYITI